MRDHIHIRRFLNRKGSHAGAYVYARIGDSTTCRDADCDHEWCIDTTLRISACSRTVSLDFELETAAERRNSLHNVTTLIDALTQFRDALVIEADRAAGRTRASRSR